MTNGASAVQDLGMKKTEYCIARSASVGFRSFVLFLYRVTG